MNIIDNILRIDHKNKITYFDPKSLIELKESLYDKLENLGEVNNNDTLKYFDKIICDIKNNDSYTSSIQIVKKITYNNKVNLIDEEKVYELTDLLSKKIISNNIFVLNENNINLIGKLLIKCFNDLSSIYSISTHKEFLNKLYNREISYEEIPRTRSSSIVETFDPVGYITGGKQKIFPEYIQDIREEFQFIKALHIILPENKNVDIYNYMLVLLNINWLFGNVLEIIINFDNENLIKCLSEEYIKNNTFQINKEYKNIFEILLMIPLFICGLNNVHSLKICMTDSFQAELDFLLKVEKILTNNFHILDLFNLMYDLSTLDINFNSLDSNTFRRILSLIHTSNSLKCLSLNLFPTEEFFNRENITKFANLYELNIKKNRYSNFVDDKELIMDNLILYFESNLEYLLFILYSKMNNLNSLKITFDIPNILFQNEKYNSILYKFTVNIFKIIDVKVSNLQNIEIRSNNFTLNSRINTNLNTVIENLKISDNSSINNYTINMRFYKINNIRNIIPKNVEYLSLEELDNDTLENFTSIFDVRNYFKSLCILKIKISQIYFDNKILDTLLNFIKARKSNIQELWIKTSLKLENEQIYKIIDIMKKDNIPHYELYLGKNKDIGNLDKYFYYEVNTRIYSIYYALRKKYNITSKTIYGKLSNYLNKKKEKIINITFI